MWNNDLGRIKFKFNFSVERTSLRISLINEIEIEKDGL